MSATIGQKVRFFRKHRKKSQFDLEIGIGAAHGSISRIENDETNPTKETLLALCNFLELNEKEKDYVFGIIDAPATQEEIEKARGEVKELMETPGELAYLLDDRGRLIDISDTFLELFEVEIQNKPKILGLPLLNLLFHPEFGSVDKLNPEHKEVILYNIIFRFYIDRSFFINDPIIKLQIDLIKRTPVLLKLWKRAISSDPMNFQGLSDREVVFNLNGNVIKLYFTVEFLNKYRRFELIQYLKTEELPLASKLL